MDKNTPELWSSEYSKEGIPSSFRDSPSEAVLSFLQFLRANEVRNGKVLDIGSGKGRNSLFMARQGFEVDSIDFAPGAIKELEESAKEFNLTDSIHGHCASLADKWPFQNSQFDIAIDAFCYTHMITKPEKETYRRELQRVMKPNALYLLSVPGVDDGYYGMFLGSSPNPADRVIVDPVNSISMILYDRPDIESEFTPGFDLVAYSHREHRNMMHGKEYERSTHWFIFKKK